MAINYLNSIDLNKNEILQGVIENQPNDAAAGSSPLEGQLYFNTTDHILKQYSGTAWERFLTGTDGDTTYDLTGVGSTDGTAGVRLTETGTSNHDDVLIVGAGTATVTRAANELTVTSNDEFQGTVTSVAATHAGNAFTAIIGNTSWLNPSVDIGMAGTSSQYVNGAGNLTTFPSIPTVGNGTLTVQGSGVLGGSGTFTANQSGPTTISVTHDNTPRTDTASSASSNTFTVIDSVTTNASGHVTAVNVKTQTTEDDTTFLPIKNSAGSLQFNSTDVTGLRFEGGTNVTVDFASGDQTVKINSTDQYVGTVTGIGTATSGTIQIAGTSAIPTVSTKTAAVVNGGGALATGDQIYDFVTGQIANIPSGLSFEGNWNANTDTPDLSGASPDNGQFWIVSVAGNTDLDGITDWKVGDWAIYVSTGAGTDGWQKVDNTSTLSGSGVANQLTYWTGTANVAGDAGLTYDATGNNLTVGGTITSSGGNSGEWNNSYDNMITGFSDSGSGTITLTLTQQDGGTLSTSFANPQGTMSSWTIKEGNGTESTTVSNGDVLTIAQGTGIESEMTSTVSGGTIQITNTDRGSSQNIFKNVASSSGTAVADNNNDTLTIVGAGGISTAVSGDTLTITSSNTNSANTYAATITDSVSGTTFNHGLGEDVIVQLYDATNKDTVYADVVRNGNYLNISFASTPTNSIRVLVQKIG
tara:strand:+ start:420 stop:2513 length:2094 start_codon:yes stop_codon:yes gene_type:complete